MKFKKSVLTIKFENLLIQHSLGLLGRYFKELEMSP